MKTYRIENEDTQHGMWYREDGTFDPFILKLTEGKSKDLPMDLSGLYSEGGRKWFSSCSNTTDMQHWFSDKDALELFQAGYKLFEFEAVEFKALEHEVIFTREGVLGKTEIPLNTIWNVNNERNVVTL